MGSIEITRTWTATIEVREGRVLTVLDATRSEYDLLRDQTDVAVREAASLGLLVWPNETHVVLWKTTKARGTEKDRTFHVFQDRRGVVRYE